MSSWFGWFSSLLDFLGFRERKGRVLLLGLDNAGKTTLVGALVRGAVGAYAPTAKPNPQSFLLGGVNVTMIDMGGHAEARRLWEDYMCGIHGVVFLVDAASTEARLMEAKAELHKLLTTDALRGVPMLVMGSKIDLPAARSEDALIAALGLQGQRTGKTAPRAAAGQRPWRCS